MHILCCLSVFTLPAHLCGPGSRGPGVLHQDRCIVLSRVPIRRGFSVAAPERQGEDGAHLGRGGMLPHSGPQARRPPREHASRLPGEGPPAPRGRDPVLVPDPAWAAGTSSLRDPTKSLPSRISWQKLCTNLSSMPGLGSDRTPGHRLPATWQALFSCLG